jgi:hypothetical protein
MHSTVSFHSIPAPWSFVGNPSATICQSVNRTFQPINHRHRFGVRFYNTTTAAPQFSVPATGDFRNR